MVDRFNIEIKEGDKVIFNDQWHDWSFKQHEKGTVIGFTKNYVKIKPDNKDVLKYFTNKQDYILRTSRYVIVDKSEVWRDNWMRLVAELDNYKKNVDKRVQLELNNSKDKVLLDLIDFLDDLKLAVKNGENNEGLKIILNKNLNVLKNKYKVVSINEFNDNKDITLFDSEYHEAIMTMPTDDKEKDNHIVDTIQEGYIYKDSGRILRIQKVIVYKYGE